MLSVDNSLTQIEKKIGLKKAYDLIEYSLPVIKNKEQCIRESLLSGNIKKASLYAHQSLGSVSLYGTDSLENLLKKVNKLNAEKATNPAALQELQMQVSNEFLAVTASIEQWLDYKKGGM